MRTASITVYSFNELSDKAKENVRNWHSECLAEWWDYTEDDFREVLKRMGFYDVEPAFSLSYSQGDGASFTASFSHDKPCLEAVKDHAPVDEELARIAIAIDALPIGFHGRVARNYAFRECHEYSITAEDCVIEQVDNELEATDDLVNDFATIVRDLCCWYFKQLQGELEYQTSDEAIVENCELNGYEFTADGRLFAGED